LKGAADNVEKGYQSGGFTREAVLISDRLAGHTVSCNSDTAKYKPKKREEKDPEVKKEEDSMKRKNG